MRQEQLGQTVLNFDEQRGRLDKLSESFFTDELEAENRVQGLRVLEVFHVSARPKGFIGAGDGVCCCSFEERDVSSGCDLV